MLASKDGEIQDVRAKLSELEKSSDQAASDHAGKLTDSEGEMAAANKSERTATELNTQH
ncbi:MAG: hypothetical protein L6R42_010771, partial [Xanthoria sp. 1 TBL-2021]